MIIFREPTDDQYALVADSFWRAAREVPACTGIGRDFLMQMLDAAVLDTSTKCKVMVDDGAPDEVLCWAIWRTPTQVLWYSVKPRYRGLGFGKQMLNHIGIKPGDTVACPILPPSLVGPAAKRGIRLVQRPYMWM